MVKHFFLSGHKNQKKMTDVLVLMLFFVEVGADRWRPTGQFGLRVRVFLFASFSLHSGCFSFDNNFFWCFTFEFCL